MKLRTITAILVGATLMAACGRETTKTAATHSSHAEQQQQASQSGTRPVDSQSRVPAYQDARSAKSLPPTLQPEQFLGPTREAYRVVREIPETIAQLPCYCHCDKSYGHKSLHTCFEDTHASQCAVCVNEALLAYNMQLSGLTPSQIRERIIAQYSGQ